MLLMDSHCHLDQLDLTTHAGQLDNALLAAKKLGVGYFICVCIDMNNFPAVLRIAEHYPHVWATVGVHPNEHESYDPSEDELFKLASHSRVVAIGETGLDYYRSTGDVTWQQERFRRHIRVAKKIQKPLIIHTRESSKDTLRILQEEHAEEVGGVFHCFTDSWEMAKAGLDMNFYISFSGIVTFKNARDLHEVAKKVPLSHMLIETDSPYLAPMPYRGKPNEPAYVYYVAQAIAQLKEVDYGTVAKETTTNGIKLFKLPISLTE